MIQLVDVSKGYGAQQLFAGVTWHVDRFPRIGLVGPNGAGKSTLLQVLAGHQDPDRGRVVLPRGVRVGYLPQEVGEIEGRSALAVVLQGRADLVDLEAQLAALDDEMAHAEPAALQRLTERHGELHARFEATGGYRFVAEAKGILAALGFAETDHTRPPAELSGGWRMRLLLAQLLLQKPELLLLDEPTNHLDLEAMRWLESFLAQYPGTVVLVSHDRAFLDRTVEAVAALERADLRVWPGNYTRYAQARDEEREHLAKAAESQAREIADAEAFIERFRAKATKAKQVQSRVKALDKVERIVLDGESRTVSFKLPEGPRSGHIVCELVDVAKAYGPHVVYDALKATFYRGDRVALVGPNGAGKSTLLKILAGVLGIDGGSLRLGHQVEQGYFAQHQVEALDFDKTVLGEMTAHAGSISLTEVRTLLGAFLFSGDAVDKPIRVLSGGEKNRLALAKILLGRPNFLLLDEPTNHLDLASRDALEGALSGFGGSMVFISHDRYFINRLATHVVHVEGGRLETYPGNYDDYLAARERANAQLVETAPLADARSGSSRKDKRRELAEARARRRAATGELRARVSRLEADVAAREAAVQAAEQALADPATYTDGPRVARLSAERAKAAAELEKLLEAWAEAQAELDELDAQFDAAERAASGEDA